MPYMEGYGPMDEQNLLIARRPHPTWPPITSDRVRIDRPEGSADRPDRGARGGPPSGPTGTGTPWCLTIPCNLTTPGW